MEIESTLVGTIVGRGWGGVVLIGSFKANEPYL